MHVDISDAFINRDSLSVSDETLIKIQKSYAAARKHQEFAGELYQVSREWQPIYQSYLATTIETLLQGDVRDLRAIYDNFFRHPCSTGLHGLHFKMVEKYMSGQPSQSDLQIYLNACVQAAGLFLLSCKPSDPRVLQRPCVGNPYGYNIIDNSGSKIFVYTGAEYHFHYANIIDKLSLKDYRALELGGGFGGMASFLLRSKRLGTYIGLDLPENLALQAFYLSALYPEKRIALYGGAPLEQLIANLSTYDVLLLPNFCIEQLPPDSINIAFNSYSLAEMSYEVANNYIKNICRITKTHIYHVNHTVWAVNADAFEIDYSKFELLFRFPTMWGKDPLQPKIDHHDFLYRIINHSGN